MFVCLSNQSEIIIFQPVLGSGFSVHDEETCTKPKLFELDKIDLDSSLKFEFETPLSLMSSVSVRVRVEFIRAHR